MLNIEKKTTQSKLDMQGELSLFLKRRRIELGLKLEDLSSGICSTSYLSRIENNQVDVDSTYYEALFEKMNINYETVKESRRRNLYHEILTAYINNDISGIEDVINHAIISKSYIDTEIDLYLLFYNIVTKNYEEARKILIKIENIKKSLNSYELLFFMFSFALYTHKTNQNRKAYHQLLLLNEIVYEDVLIESCIYDLGIDVMEAVGMELLGFNYYHNLEQIAGMPLFRERLLLHKMKFMIKFSEVDSKGILKDVLSITKNIDFTKEYNKETYYYYLALLYYKIGDYEELAKLLKDNLLSARCVCLLGTVCFNTQDNELARNISNIINEYKFNKYETYFLDFCKFISLYLNDNSDYVLLNYLKNILFNKSQFYYDLIETIKLEKYVPLLMACGKYKEASREFVKFLNNNKHKKLI